MMEGEREGDNKKENMSDLVLAIFQYVDNALLH